MSKIIKLGHSSYEPQLSAIHNFNNASPAERNSILKQGREYRTWNARGEEIVWYIIPGGIIEQPKLAEDKPAHPRPLPSLKPYLKNTRQIASPMLTSNQEDEQCTIVKLSCANHPLQQFEDPDNKLAGQN